MSNGKSKSFRRRHILHIAHCSLLIGHLGSAALLTFLGTLCWNSQTQAGEPQSAPPAAATGSAAEESFLPQSPQAGSRRDPGPRLVFKDHLTPHWFARNTRFWYCNNLRSDAKEFIVVEADKGTRWPAFDHATLAAALSKAAGSEYKPDRLPFSSIAFVENGKAVAFKTG